jgi:predicted ATP-grasp superfamily ATP-dependent carboligase
MVTSLSRDRTSAADTPQPAAGRQRTVIITDAGHSVSIPFIRSFAQHGWRVVAASHERGSLGFRSRYAHRRLVYAWPGRRPGEFVASIARSAQQADADLVVPLSEAAVMALDANRERLPAGCQVAIPSTSALAVAMDRHRTMTLAHELGVPTPASQLVSSPGEALRAALKIDGPYVLKLARGFQEQGTRYAASLADVLDQARRIMGGGQQILVQQYVAGHGVGVNLLMSAGRPLLAFQHRRLREVPVSGGPSALRESVPLDPCMYRDAVRMLEALDWTGLAMVEFRVSENRYRLMEINGRAWGSLPLASAAGVDFPAALARLYEHPEGAGRAEMPAYAVGVRSRNLYLDVVWALSVILRRPASRFAAWPPRRDGFRALVQLLDPRIHFDVQSRDDPAPGMVELGRLLRFLARRLVRR